MKAIDMEKLEQLNSIDTPRKKDFNHSKKPNKGTRIGPPGSTLQGCQQQTQQKEHQSRFNFQIPSVKSTQTKRLGDDRFNRGNRKKRPSNSSFLDEAFERQREEYHPNNYRDRDVWTYTRTNIAKTQSNRKKRYGRNFNNDRTKSDNSFLSRSSKQDEWDDHKNYSSERNPIEIDLNSDDEQEVGKHQDNTLMSPSHIDRGQEKNHYRVEEEQDSNKDLVETVRKDKPKKCHSIQYAVNEDDPPMDSLTGDSHDHDEKSWHAEGSSFSTAAIEKRLKESTVATTMNSVVQNVLDRKNSRGIQSHEKKLSRHTPTGFLSFRKVNNDRSPSICPPKKHQQKRESIESVDSDDSFPLIKKKETSDDEYTPTKVSSTSSSKKKMGVGEKAIQRVREKASKYVTKSFNSLVEWSSPPSRETRSSSSKKRKQQAKEEVIILSSDDDESLVDDSSLCDESEIGSPLQTRSSPRKLRIGDRPRIIAQRLAIGSKVFKNVSFSVSVVGKTDLIIEYQKANGENMKHRFSCQDVNRAYCYIPDRSDQLSGSSTEDEEPNVNKKSPESEEPKHELSYLIFRAPSKANTGFDKFSNSYLDDTSFEELDKKRSGGTTKENEKRYIALEFACAEEFEQFLKRFNRVLSQNGDDFFASLLDSGQLKSHEKDGYILPLLKSARKSRNGTKNNDDSMKNVKDDEIMLVFPFPASPDEFDSAATGMKEASVWGDLNTCPSPYEISQGKTHMVTIRGEDYKRLIPMEFLNDSLIDFWMKWITRMEPGSSQSKIHIFTTQFFSALEDNGVDAVTKWTARKDIDIFDKKFILIPINKDLHWSLCVVVNPGKITNGDKILPNMNDIEEGMDLDAPFLLLMDSLRMHKKGRIQSQVYDWLNSEAKRLGRFDDLRTEAGIFNKRTMPMFDPRVPRQENSWDCGVFVCRYGYAVHRLYMEGVEFKVKAGTTKKDYQAQISQLISSHQAFDFNMDDIERIRVEMKQLLENLSTLYIKSRKKEKLSKRKKHDEIESKASAVYTSKANSIEEQEI